MPDYSRLILNLLTLIISSFTCLIALIILISIIHHLCYNRIKQEDKIVFIQCINIYILLFIHTILCISLYTQTLLGDLYGQDFNSSSCIFRGYTTIVVLGLLYWAFINQAFFRLCRIVYTSYRWFQSLWLYIILTPIELIVVCIFLSLLLFLHDFVYLTKEYYCFVPMSNVRGNLWLALSVYGFSVLLLSLIYFRITIFLRRQTNNQTLIVKKRQERDLLIIRRIAIVFSLLVATGIPGIVLLIKFYITGEEHPLTVRIEWFSMSISMFGLSISQIIFTPQLKNIIWKKFQHVQIVPVDAIAAGSIHIGYRTTIL